MSRLNIWSCLALGQNVGLPSSPRGALQGLKHRSFQACYPKFFYRRWWGLKLKPYACEEYALLQSCRPFPRFSLDTVLKWIHMPFWIGIKLGLTWIAQTAVLNEAKPTSIISIIHEYNKGKSCNKPGREEGGKPRRFLYQITVNFHARMWTECIQSGGDVQLTFSAVLKWTSPVTRKYWKN